MSSVLKDLAVLVFSAGEELEKKAEEYRQERKKREKEFEEKIRQRKEQVKEKYQDDIDAIKGRLSEAAGKLGLATREEIDELKAMVKQLSDKLDNIER